MDNRNEMKRVDTIKQHGGFKSESIGGSMRDVDSTSTTIADHLFFQKSQKMRLLSGVGGSLKMRMLFGVGGGLLGKGFGALGKKIEQGLPQEKSKLEIMEDLGMRRIDALNMLSNKHHPPENKGRRG